jgi:hypothetical protein
MSFYRFTYYGDSHVLESHSLFELAKKIAELEKRVGNFDLESKTSNNECKIEKIEDTKRTCQGYIFFDYECTVVENKHIPNLIMARKVLLNPNNFEQYTVDAEMYTFRTNNSFCKWLIKHEDFIAIAHNMKGYDGAFILQYFLNNFRGDDTMPTCLITGTTRPFGVSIAIPIL